MIVNEGKDFIAVKVDVSFINKLIDMNIYLERNFNKRPSNEYIKRLTEKDIVLIHKDGLIEEFCTFGSGYAFHTCGSFSSLASSLGHNTSIGRFTSIGNNVSRLGLNHPLRSVTTNPAIYNFNRETISGYFNSIKLKDSEIPHLSPVDMDLSLFKKIEIGHDVWIGQDCLIKGGISIGHGAVIGARALVNKDVPPYAVVGGLPARFIRYRFPKEIQDGLNETRWWEYELADMHKLSLPFSHPEKFIESFLKNKSNLRIYSPRKINLYEFLKKTH
jgi:acetyltransferase-like isoleucine patch superfamily enzyme